MASRRRSPAPTAITPPRSAQALALGLEYTLIPTFMRAVRNITSLGDVLGRPAGQQNSPCTRIVLVGGGPLVDAARVVAAHRTLPIEIAGGGVFERAAQAFARLRSGRATKWVNTDFRALVLEPGFIFGCLLKASGSASPLRPLRRSHAR